MKFFTKHKLIYHDNTKFSQNNQLALGPVDPLLNYNYELMNLAAQQNGQDLTNQLHGDFDNADFDGGDQNR